MTEPSATVYVVDDEPDMLKALERLLGAAGFSVRTFPSPEQFLAQHDDTTPGCIVLDLALPGLNGLELQQALQAQGSALPIVFLITAASGFTKSGPTLAHPAVRRRMATKKRMNLLQ